MNTERVIFITGSSRGLGAGAAKLAKKLGWLPVLHGREDSPALSALADELQSPKVVADVSDKKALSKAIEKTYEQLGRLDALVCCAGIVKPKPFLEMKEEDWQDEYQINVLGTIYACQTAIPLMLGQEHGGRIVTISSLRGLSPTSAPRGVAYSISKAAIVNLTEALAKEFAPKVAVNAVAPGFIETDMSRSWNEAVWTQARSALLGRTGTPEEIAHAIMFLASRDASFITGQTLLVDGGYTCAGK
ncbi:MAG: SDR family NAD(P)-dependent oxidoreductase [Alphaproteobacteria bacterium]|nr:SDR family NAD(P)-dependent oxidoreductase [Alphaproteobacteria bacterium]